MEKDERGKNFPSSLAVRSCKSNPGRLSFALITENIAFKKKLYFTRDGFLSRDKRILRKMKSPKQCRESQRLSNHDECDLFHLRWMTINVCWMLLIVKHFVSEAKFKLIRTWTSDLIQRWNFLMDALWLLIFCDEISERNHSDSICCTKPVYLLGWCKHFSSGQWWLMTWFVNCFWKFLLLKLINSNEIRIFHEFIMLKDQNYLI